MKDCCNYLPDAVNTRKYELSEQKEREEREGREGTGRYACKSGGANADLCLLSALNPRKSIALMTPLNSELSFIPGTAKRPDRFKHL